MYPGETKYILKPNNKMTPTTTSNESIAAVEEAQESYLSIAFVLDANYLWYGHIIEELDNKFLK